MKTIVIVSVSLFLASSLPADDTSSAPAKQTRFYTWENVGEITSLSGKTFTLQQILRLSEATWSLLPGTISSPSQLQPGDQIHARGYTMPDGIYDTRQIFLTVKAPLASPGQGGTSPVQGTDYEGPNIRHPGRELGYPGTGGRVPSVGRPKDGGIHSPGGVQTAQSSAQPRFLPGDVVGIIKQVTLGRLILPQAFGFDKDTVIRGKTGKKVNEKSLQVGLRVAVTIKDEFDEKSLSRKATVVRILP